MTAIEGLLVIPETVRYASFKRLLSKKTLRSPGQIASISIRRQDNMCLNGTEKAFGIPTVWTVSKQELKKSYWSQKYLSFIYERT